ncbi:nucleolar protein 58-like [Camellia sinensis]|uniref:nucleolar protein 58-like n=1 Tax=Camellia sinensis TaxID=4442 RepID=UPI0010363344|nr:nucleolar protein 58-like [Camellia sinensis]
MAHNEDLLQSAINGQTPEGGRRREGLPSIPPMAELDPQRRNLQREAREKQGSSPHRSQSPDRQMQKMDPQVLEDCVREQDEVIRRMTTDIESMKSQIKDKREKKKSETEEEDSKQRKSKKTKTEKKDLKKKKSSEEERRVKRRTSQDDDDDGSELEEEQLRDQRAGCSSNKEAS